MAYNVQRTSIYTLHAAMVHEHFDGCHMYICIYSGRTRSLYNTQSIIYIFFILLYGKISSIVSYALIVSEKRNIHISE